MKSDKKIVIYETEIEDMLHVLEERLSEFTVSESLSEFEQGRQVAYLEMKDIIKTRHKIILDVISEQ